MTKTTLIIAAVLASASSVGCGGETSKGEQSGAAAQPEAAPPENDGGAPDGGGDAQDPPGECEEGAVREGAAPCGEDGEGVTLDACVDGGWAAAALCLESPRGEYEELNLGTGYGPAEWDYEQADFPARGLYGWSYYIRAFDLVRDTPVREIGWGQWSKPSMPADGLDVCGVHPHGFVCEEVESLDGELENCGHTDPELLEGCRVWCCAEDDKCGVRGSIEGGMGYWMYTLETPHVKWMLPGATNANYETFGGTFLNDRPQPCTSLGGAVRVANRLLVPDDFISFEGDDVDGFLGYMLTRTPIAKRSPTDEANHWTIIVDTANFAGPVMVMSSWFWDARINWHPSSVSWSDPRALIGYIAQGFEGRVGAIKATDAEGRVWRRTNRWGFPRDRVEGALTDKSTLFTGHNQYSSDWAAAAVEPMLSGTGSLEARRPAAIEAAARAAGLIPECMLPEAFTELELEFEDGEREILWGGFGVGEASIDEEEARAEAEAAGCHMRLSLDPSRLDCTNTPGWCEGTPYIVEGEGQTAPVAPGDVPPEVKAALNLRGFEASRRNDGRFLGPPAPSEESCFEQPGPAPADPRLYCTRTGAGVWIGFKWYRFIDQPELNQFFASLPGDEREAAKCFMQARIERLHEAQQADPNAQPRWYEAPQGAQNLPGDKVRIDAALLLEPPAGLEKGFVPIPLFQRKRTRPEGCEVVLGDHMEEPDPLPSGYYEGYAFEGGGYDTEVCPANEESGGAFTYPGTVFPYSPGPDQTQRAPYHVPTRAEVGQRLGAEATRCGLFSDPP